MRKIFIEGLVVFVSILASISVDNMRESNEGKEILKRSFHNPIIKYFESQKKVLKPFNLIIFLTFFIL